MGSDLNENSVTYLISLSLLFLSLVYLTYHSQNKVFWGGQSGSQASLKRMYGRKEGPLIWGLIAFSGCVWGECFQATGRELGSLNFPLTQDRLSESLLMVFPKGRTRKEYRRVCLESYQRPNIKNGIRLYYRCSCNIPLSAFVILSDTS